VKLVLRCTYLPPQGNNPGGFTKTNGGGGGYLGPKGEDVTAQWRKFHSKELNDLYSLPNIIRTNMWRRMRCEGHAEEKKIYTKFWKENLKEGETIWKTHVLMSHY
jgi:hypothetical protein